MKNMFFTAFMALAFVFGSASVMAHNHAEVEKTAVVDVSKSETAVKGEAVAKEGASEVSADTVKQKAQSKGESFKSDYAKADGCGKCDGCKKDKGGCVDCKGCKDGCADCKGCKDGCADCEGCKDGCDKCEGCGEKKGAKGDCGGCDKDKQLAKEKAFAEAEATEKGHCN